MTVEQYVKSVQKSLNCKREKRKTICKDLAADISAALEHGETWEDIKTRLGDPKDIALEFNENMEISDKPSKTKPFIFAIAFIVLVIIGVYIGNKAYISFQTPKDYEFGTFGIFKEDEVVERCKKIIELTNQGDYKTLNDYCSAETKDLLNEEVMKAAKSYFTNDWDSFEEIEHYSLIERKIGFHKIVLARLEAKYIDQTIVFTIVLDKNLQMTAIYMG